MLSALNASVEGHTEETSQAPLSPECMLKRPGGSRHETKEMCLAMGSRQYVMMRSEDRRNDEF